MKIACISTSQVPSDTANSIQTMKVCQAFAQLGHAVTLLVPGAQPEGLQLAVLQSRYGIHTPFEIEWLPTRSRRTFPWRAALHARYVGAELLYAWPVQSAALGLLAGLPTMLEMHDFPTGAFGPLWFRFFVLQKGRKRLLPITHALRKALERRYPPLPEGLVVIAPDGVDIERYVSLPAPESARRQLGLPLAPTALCTGHLYAGRGVDLFLALAGRFPQVSFVWVGGRPDEVKTWKTRAAAQSLANVAFTGFIPNERIPLYQSAADVLLMPYQRSVATSSGGDTAEICSPMKMFEYMAAGRAILTSDLPVLREVLDDSTAVFCPMDDAGTWESALRGLLEDEKRRQALAQQARRAVERYSWVERAKRVLEGFAYETDSA
jgi:glycosyltransferase involved in cell wall biosynthesis